MFAIAGNSPSGYNLTRSLRFRASASAYLSRTPAASGNRQIFTYSCWLKRGILGTSQGLLVGNDTSTDISSIEFYNDTLRFYTDRTSANVFVLATTAVFRDPSAWYHIVVALDTTQATSTNRVKMYVNNVQQTLTGSYPTQNYSQLINGGDVQRISKAISSYFDGYLAEINFIDGQALTPSSFGEFDTTTGVWKPKAYTGTYGTNGFYLPFTDNSALTTSSNVGLGKDFSGNGNYWTTNNISITAGTTYDSMTDVPTLTSTSASNFAVMNPLAYRAVSTPAVITDGNLLVTCNNASTDQFAFGSIYPSSGKWYWEVTAGTIPSGGSIQIGVDSGLAQSSTYTDYVVYTSGGNKTIVSTTTAYGASFTTGDVIGVALDRDGGTVTFYKNNVSQGAITLPSTAALSAFFRSYSATTNGVGTFNFGQRPFTYTPPTGFVALNAYNLPDSTIKQGNKVMDATLFTSIGSAQSIVNAAGFKPDLVWIKARGEIASPRLADSVRGVDKILYSNQTAAEATEDGVVDSFNTNGFTGGGANAVTSGYPGVAWQWQAGQGSTSSNTSGTITSTVSVNASAGFSIVTYSAGASNSTVGHGLGVAPALIIAKSRSVSPTSWPVYHQSLGKDYALELNTTGAVVSIPNYWGTGGVTSTTFGVSLNTYGNNYGNMVAYCWSEIAGFSKFGSYTGNGSADGTFVYTGFKTKWLLLKRTDAAGDWILLDTSRSTYNATQNTLYPNGADAESTSTAYATDILSNGFKMRNSYANLNGSGITVIYAAFAENPFKNSLAR